MTRPEAALIDELEFRSYVHNRKQFPEVEQGRWAAIFSNVPEMEERLSTGNILDVAPRYWCPTSGNEYQHPGKCPECGDTLEIVEDVADRATGNAPVTDGLQVGDEGGGEILSSSPLYLLASEIVDVVTKGYEQ